MDKYEYRVSLNEINSLVEEKRFDEAAQIADTIDWRKVRSKDTLCRISDIYKIIKDYDRARDILDLANQRNPHVPEIIYSLCELTIFLYGQTGSQSDLAKAIGLKQEYQSEFPDDPKRLILEYKFYKVSPVTVTEKIATLEQLRDEDHSPRWGYELATLYREAGMDELAVDECKQICRQFGGRFADKAAALAQELKADARASREAADEEPDDRDAEPARRVSDEAPSEDRADRADRPDRADRSDRAPRTAEDRRSRENEEPVREAHRDVAEEDAEPVRRERHADDLAEEAPTRGTGRFRAVDREAEADEVSVREADRFRAAGRRADEESDDLETAPERRRAATIVDDDIQSGDTGISGIRRKPYRDPAEVEEPSRSSEPETETTSSPYSVTDRVQEGGTSDRVSSRTGALNIGAGDTVDGVRRFDRMVREEPVSEPETTPAAGAAAGSDDQLSVGQVYDEWERIRRDIRKRNDEKRAQRIMEDTGPLLQDFDETARHGLIETIEKDAARQRRQVRSGAASILGNGGYGDSYGRGGNNRYADPYGDRRGGNRYEDPYNQGRGDRRGYNAPAEDRYNEPADDRYNDRYAQEPAEDRYDDRYAQEPAEDRYDDRYAQEPAEDRYDDRYAQEPAEDQYNDRYNEPADNRYNEPQPAPYEEAPRRHGGRAEQYAEPAQDQYNEPAGDGYNDRYDDRRPAYEPLPEPEDTYPEREEIQAETVHEDPLPVGYDDGEPAAYEEAPRRHSARYADEASDDAEDDVRGGINDRESFGRQADAADAADAGVAAGVAGVAGAAAGFAAGAAAGTAAGARRGSRFNAAVNAADAAMHVVEDVAEDAADDAAEDDDIATRRWNSEEVRKAMEEQKARIAEAEAAAAAEAARKAAEEEAARIAAEEEARRQAEEEARRKAEEERAAERARIEAEIRAEYEAKERARIAAEEEARRKAEEEAARKAAEEEARRQAEAEAARKAEEERLAAEAKAREEAEAMARMRAEIEAQIRAEYEQREQARIAALGVAPAAAPAAAPVTEAVASAPAVEAVPPVSNIANAAFAAPQAYEAEADEAEEPAMAPAAFASAPVEEPAYEAEGPVDEAFPEDEPMEEPLPEMEEAPAEELESEETFPEEIPSDVDNEPLPADADEAFSETVEDDEPLPEMEEAPAQEPIPEAEEAPAEEPAAPRRGRRRPRRGSTIDDDLARPADMETAEIPASAASSIAAAAEKPPSEEELRLFGPFYRMKENRDQVTAALDKISLASYTGNIVITGNAVTARRVAQGLLELTREADSNFTGKIAKATGSALNKLTEDRLRGILDKIQNGALIIEHASVMEESAVQNLYNELENRDRGVVVVLMDARKPLDAFLQQYSGQMSSFTARVDIRPLNDKALVDYGKDYANMRDYALDELAELALSSRISSMQSPNHRVTLKEVRDIVDEAISYASKKSPKVLVDMISRKRYDDDDRIILREKDFQHGIK